MDLKRPSCKKNHNNNNKNNNNNNNKTKTKKYFNLDHRLSLSVAQLVAFWFKSFMPMRDSPQLCVRMRCLSICAPSFVALVWFN